MSRIFGLVRQLQIRKKEKAEESADASEDKEEVSAEEDVSAEA